MCARAKNVLNTYSEQQIGLCCCEHCSRADANVQLPSLTLQNYTAIHFYSLHIEGLGTGGKHTRKTTHKHKKTKRLLIGNTVTTMNQIVWLVCSISTWWLKKTLYEHGSGFLSTCLLSCAADFTQYRCLVYSNSSSSSLTSFSCELPDHFWAWWDQVTLVGKLHTDGKM